MEIHIILSLFFFTILSFFDFIVYNEEILLTLCFLAFLFYCFNSLSESIASSIEARSAKFEDDLLFTYNNSKNLLIASFELHSQTQNIIGKFSILFSSLINYLSVCKTLLGYKSSWIFYQIALTKLNELVSVNRNYTTLFQQSCIKQLLYSLVLIKSNNDLTFLLSNTKSSKKFTELKNLSL